MWHYHLPCNSQSVTMLVRLIECQTKRFIWSVQQKAVRALVRRDGNLIAAPLFYFYPQLSKLFQSAMLFHRAPADMEVDDKQERWCPAVLTPPPVGPVNRTGFVQFQAFLASDERDTKVIVDTLATQEPPSTEEINNCCFLLHRWRVMLFSRKVSF